jgi:SAM-dependent methyltransferase
MILLNEEPFLYIMKTYRTMSDYLETILDRDKSILVVGPGLSSGAFNGSASLPMDMALLWFAEQLYQRKGRLDVIDLPARSLESGHPGGGRNNIKRVRSYMDLLAKRESVTKANFIEGDITKMELPKDEYGLIWDHGTFSWHEDRRVLTKYMDALQSGGKLALAKITRSTKPIEGYVGMKQRVVAITTDLYKTNLTEEQVFMGLKWNRQRMNNDVLVAEQEYKIICETTKAIRT